MTTPLKEWPPQAAELLANFITLAETPALKTQARLDQVEVALNLNPSGYSEGGNRAGYPSQADVGKKNEQLSPEQTITPDQTAD